MKNKEFDDKMRAALRAAMQREQEQLEEEMKQVEPHVFSDEFNQKMDKLLTEMAVKSKRRERINFLLKACAVVACCMLLVVGATTFASVSAKASEAGMNVIEWCEKYFLTRVEPSDIEEGIAFDEKQIGYIPEGFEKTLEEKISSGTSLKYENNEEYFILFVQKKEALIGIDAENEANNVNVSDKGIEYRLTYKIDTKENIFIWFDENGNRYTLTSSLDNEENLKILDGIIY